MQQEPSGSGGIGETAQQAAAGVAERAQELGGQAVEQTRAVREQAGERMREEVDQRTTQAAEQASSMAQVARRVGDELRQQGSDGQARYADQAAEQIDRLGGYLRQADANMLVSDLERFGRGQPIAMAAGGILVGVFAARFLKASSGQRSASSGPSERAQLPPASAAGQGQAATPMPTGAGW